MSSVTKALATPLSFLVSPVLNAVAAPPNVPPQPPPRETTTPEPTSSQENAQVQQAAAEEVKRDRKRSGRQSTILTSAQGVQNGVTPIRKTLLGGTR